MTNAAEPPLRPDNLMPGFGSVVTTINCGLGLLARLDELAPISRMGEPG